MSDQDTIDRLLEHVWVRCAAYPGLPSARVVFEQCNLLARTQKHPDLGLLTVMIGEQVAVLAHIFQLTSDGSFERKIEALLASGGRMIDPPRELVVAFTLRRAKQMLTEEGHIRADGMQEIHHRNVARLLTSDGGDVTAPDWIIKRMIHADQRGEN